MRRRRLPVAAVVVAMHPASGFNGIPAKSWY